jgi:uncharacterized protein
VRFKEPTVDFVAERIADGKDLRQEIERIVKDHNIEAGSIVCGIGGLSRCRIRVPVENGQQARFIDPGSVEIASMQGTLSLHSAHIHLAVSDHKGETWGGHLSEGCIVRLTCELVIARHRGLIFDRVLDPHTGFEELVIEPM